MSDLDRPADVVTVWTDGACLRNPGPGGWAWAVEDGRSGSGGDAHTTNQRMEITAAYEAIRALPGRLLLISDSTYVVNCFRQRWWAGWERRGWRNARGDQVANQDLWRPLVATALDRGVQFDWVKGHAGNVMNERVDELARQQALLQSGTGRTTGRR